MSAFLCSLLRLAVCGVLLAFGAGAAPGPQYVAMDYIPALDPGDTWDFEVTRNSVPEGVTRTTVLQQTKNIGGIETRILERSPTGSQGFLTSDAAGLRQHGLFDPASGDRPDASVIFDPPLTLVGAVVEAGDVLEATGSAVFRFRGVGTFTGSYAFRSTVFGIESITVPYRVEPFQALRVDATLEMLVTIPGNPPMSFTTTDTAWYGFGVGTLRDVEVYDRESVEEDLLATNLPEPVSSCNDGLDNDGDALIDYPNDPGCFDPASDTEDPECQDGADNDGDGNVDFDGGLTALGYVAAAPDLQCIDGSEPNESESAPTPTPTPTPLPVGDMPMCNSKRGSQMTVLVPPSRVQVSLDKGLTMGECSDPVNGLVMCKAKRGKMATILVPHGKVQRSLDKGLTLGVCRVP